MAVCMASPTTLTSSGMATILATLLDKLTRPEGLPPSAPLAGTLHDSRQAEFGALLHGIAVIAGLTHLAFCGLFFWAGVDALAYINVGSVVLYVSVFFWARRGRIHRAWFATVSEVMGHAVLAVAVIGWNSGFHYYILLVIPVAAVSAIRPVWLRAGVVLLAMLSYLAMDIQLRHSTPPHRLPGVVLDGLHYFNVLGVMVILLFLAAYYYQLINEAEARLRAVAATDPLTQLHNRRAIDDVTHREHSRAMRGGHPLSFLLCDLDHFKRVNDDHGHEAGDAVLQAVSAALAHGVRVNDHVARWGGEEFLAVLPDADQADAKRVAERLRLAVEQLRIDHNGVVLTIQVTIGVATLQAGESVDEVIARADGALYEGKRAGRNRVEVSRSPVPVMTA